jgi:ATP-dependent helicase/nuclease subunit B
MSRAVHSVSDALKLFGVPDRRADFYVSMLRTYDELKSAGISPALLSRTAEKLEGPLGVKLFDLSLIFSAYEGMTKGDKIDPGDRLSRLADQIGRMLRSAIAEHLFIRRVYRFTAQELLVLDELLKKDASMTVCLTCDGLAGTEKFSKYPERRPFVC